MLKLRFGARESRKFCTNAALITLYLNGQAVQVMYPTREWYYREE
jgi:hypothetical protein